MAGKSSNRDMEEQDGLDRLVVVMTLDTNDDAIEFDVHAVPVAQPRQRSAFVNGQVRNYTPTKHPVNAFKASCREAASAVYDGPPLRDPLRLTLTFVMPRPRQMMWKTKPMPRVSHAKRPDLDNLAKAVKDALSKLVWHDDSQIAQLDATKVIAAGDEQPHVTVKVEVI